MSVREFVASRRAACLLGIMVLAGIALAAPAPAGSRRAANGHVDLVLPAPAAAVQQAAPPPGTMEPGSEYPADGETDPVGARGDVADDMVFWAHPADAARSVMIGTNKEGGLEVYDLAGRRLQVVDPASGPSNVDLRRGFDLAGKAVDVVAVTGNGMRFYTIDPDSRVLTNVTSPAVKPDIPVAGGCLYHSPVTGKLYLFADTPAGQVEQWELVDEGGVIGATSVRGPWSVGSETEACVADDANQSLYVAEEDVGIWRYGAEPDSPAGERTLVDGIASRRLAPDIEGLALVEQADGGGYLLASSQGDDAFVVYRRSAPWEFVKKFRVSAGNVTDRCTGTDGIDATASALGPLYPRGAFSCQDHVNDYPGNSGNQNFKLVRLEKILDLQ